MISMNISGNLGLPLVPVLQQLLLVVQQLLVRLGGELKVGSLDDGVDRTGLLAETAVDALGHVDVVAGGTTRSVRPFLRLDGDGLRRADGLAQLAGDATLLAGGVTSEGVLASETGAQGTLFEGVVYGGRFFEDVRERDAETTYQFGEEHRLGCPVFKNSNGVLVYL